MSFSNNINNTINTLTVARGGTQLTSAPSNGQLLVGNNSGTFTLATITGLNIDVTNASGSITLNSSTGSIAFLAYVNSTISNVTGADTTYYLASNLTEEYDVGNNFNSSTGVFTAPSNGLYIFSYSVTTTGMPSSLTGYVLELTYTRSGVDFTYFCYGGNPYDNREANGYYCYNGSTTYNLNANDTVKFGIRCGGSTTDTTDILGATDRTSWVSGALIRKL